MALEPSNLKRWRSRLADRAVVVHAANPHDFFPWGKDDTPGVATTGVSGRTLGPMD
jgi:hypothetical protein